MQTSVLLSIKPKFVERIFQGTKRYEFRRSIFRNQGISKIVVYASAPISKVVGEFEIETILKLETDELWDQTKDHSGIPKTYFDNYFYGREVGFAIKIGNTQLYRELLDLKESFNIQYAPQSFMYIHH